VEAVVVTTPTTTCLDPFAGPAYALRRDAAMASRGKIFNGADAVPAVGHVLHESRRTV
jgi:hypothetical protein